MNTKKFKMIYFIERHDSLPFDDSITECRIGKKVYDLVVHNKDLSLERIADHVIDDSQLGMVFLKTNPREQKRIEEFIEFKYGPMQELLLG